MIEEKFFKKEKNLKCVDHLSHRVPRAAREQQPGWLRKPEKPLHGDMTGLGLEQLLKRGDSRFPAHEGRWLGAKGDVQVPRSGDPGLGSWHSPPHRGVLLLSEHVDQDGPPVRGEEAGRGASEPWEERGAGREVLAGTSTHAVQRRLHPGLRVDFDWIQGVGTLCAGRSWRGQ